MRMCRPLQKVRLPLRKVLLLHLPQPRSIREAKFDLTPSLTGVLLNKVGQLITQVLYMYFTCPAQIALSANKLEQLL